MSDSTHYRDIHPVVISWRLTIVRWGGELYFLLERGVLVFGSMRHRGGC